MTPQTVNAYYNPPMNEIVFPAAILQPPFFDMVADDAVRWMVPDAAQAQCTEEVMATAVQEYCQAVAWTRSSRKG